MFYPKHTFFSLVILQSWANVVGRVNEVFMIFCNFCVLSYNSASFSKFCLQFSVQLTLHNVETRKILDTRFQCCF